MSIALPHDRANTAPRPHGTIQSDQESNLVSPRLDSSMLTLHYVPVSVGTCPTCLLYGTDPSLSMPESEFENFYNL